MPSVYNVPEGIPSSHFKSQAVDFDAFCVAAQEIGITVPKHHNDVFLHGEGGMTVYLSVQSFACGKDD